MDHLMENETGSKNLFPILILVMLTMLVSVVLTCIYKDNQQSNMLSRYSKVDVACTTVAYEGEKGIRRLYNQGLFQGADSNIMPIVNGKYDPSGLMSACALKTSMDEHKKKVLVSATESESLSKSLMEWVNYQTTQVALAQKPKKGP